MPIYELSQDRTTWTVADAAALVAAMRPALLPQAPNDAAFMAQWPQRQAGQIIRNDSPEMWVDDLIRTGFMRVLAPVNVLDEWKECRATIGRFDGLLVDLRKTGFSFVTAIASGATFFFAVEKSSPIPESGKFAVFTIIMVLTLTLYVVDRVHQIMQQEAVDLARRLEQDWLRFTITSLLGSKYKRSYAIGLGIGLYWVLLIAIYLASVFTSNECGGCQIAMLLELVIGLAIIEFVVLKTRLW